MPSGPWICENFSTIPCSPPTCGQLTAKNAAAIAADIMMKIWTMSITSTPQRPELRRKHDIQHPDQQQRLPPLDAEQDPADLDTRQD